MIRHQQENYVPPSQRIIRILPMVVFNVILITFVVNEMK